MSQLKRGRRVLALGLAAGLVGSCGSSGGNNAQRVATADGALDNALKQIVAAEGGPPGIAVVVQRRNHTTFHTAGVAMLGNAAPPHINDHLRLASVSKAFSGAAALALVAANRLSLSDSIGKWRPDLPKAWAAVTLAQLLQHTGGIPDFSSTPAFQQAVVASPGSPPPPAMLLSYVADRPPEFAPGSRYEYSNSDNVIIALMIEAATGRPYQQVLDERVLRPLGLSSTSLPTGVTMPTPFLHGYQRQPAGPPDDVSEVLAGGWAFASGGIVSTPNDANRFVRAYAKGGLTNRATHHKQFQFIDGSNSEPPGPGDNAVGLAIFRYRTACGTFYGHTGNTLGYTQFVAAAADGAKSVSVSASEQITPQTDQTTFAALRRIFELAVCDAVVGS